jgi:hypothetical protein
MKSIKFTLSLLAFYVVALPGLSQPITAVPNNLRASTTIQGITTGEWNDGEILYGIPIPPGKTVGDGYLHQNWMISSVLLYQDDKLLEGYPVRYDIQLDELEIKGKNGVKVLEGSKVKSFSLVDSISNRPKYYVNAREYKMADNIPLVGFFEVLADGKLPLFMKTTVAVKRANYSVHFDVGSRDDHVLKSDQYFTSIEGAVSEVPTSKKKLLHLFGNKSFSVDKFIRINSLSITNPYHLARIFQHYNDLVK